MKSPFSKSYKSTGQSPDLGIARQQDLAVSAMQLMDNRPERIAQSQLQDLINGSPRVQRLNAYQHRQPDNLQFQGYQDMAAQTPGGTVQLMQQPDGASNAPVQFFGEELVAIMAAHPWLSLAAALTIAAIGAWAMKNKAKDLDGLPEELWWKLFIDIGHHEEAQELDDPGSLYDRQESKGHQRNMLNAFKSELLNKSGKLNTRVDLAEYERLHNLVTENLDNSKKVQKWSSGDNGTEEDEHPIVQFGIGGKRRPADDIAGDTLCGLPLMVEQDRKIELDQVAITLFSQHDKRVSVNYSTGNAQQYVTAALSRYYVEVAGDGRGAKLAAIARVIRALHVIHPFRDANGRLHVMLMLNKFLKEQGFHPVILPHGPDVFGGSYTIEELVAEIEAGMHNFSQEVQVEKDKDA